MEWLKRQGPWSPGLIEYLKRHHKQYEALIFYNYLYAPTVLGLQIDPGRSILVPAAHDEPADPSRHLPRCLPAAESNRLSQRAGAAIRRADVRAQCGHRGDDGLRRRSAAASRLSESRRDRPNPPIRIRVPSRRRVEGRRTGRRRQRPVPVACVVARRQLQAAPSHSRIVRALRRADRSGQRMRGAHRVLQHVRGRRRRRIARADGPEADAAARRAVHQFRGHAVGTGAPAGAGSGDGRRRARRRTRASRSSPSRRSPSARRFSATHAATCWSITACAATAACSTGTATSSWNA